MTKFNATDINPIKDRILVIDMEFGEQKTNSGIIISDDDGISRGIRPRWSKVYKVGPEQSKIKPGQYVLMDHGRWTRAINVDLDGNQKKLYMIDFPKGVLLVSNTKPKELEKVGL